VRPDHPGTGGTCAWPAGIGGAGNDPPRFSPILRKDLAVVVHSSERTHVIVPERLTTDARSLRSIGEIAAIIPAAAIPAGQAQSPPVPGWSVALVRLNYFSGEADRDHIYIRSDLQEMTTAKGLRLHFLHRIPVSLLAAAWMSSIKRRSIRRTHRASGGDRPNCLLGKRLFVRHLPTEGAMRWPF